MASAWTTADRPARSPGAGQETPGAPGLDEGAAACGLYVHIPFCAKKCPYCDFNTYAGLEPLFERTIDALCAEMAQRQAAFADRQITSVFLGGGTPTVLSEMQLTRLIEQIHRSFKLANGCEFTSEANPGSADRAKFARLRSLGVNRISLGVQSLQPAELRFLGRIHDTDDAFRSVAAARDAGFDNINLDFMFGLPGQSLATWEETLRRALALEPEHLSLYSLIVEPDTPLHHWVQAGRVAGPDEDVAAEQYEFALAFLAQMGYRQYEVSNWARDDASDQLVPAWACRHNLVYWRNQPYSGIGPGAHSHDWAWGPAATKMERRWANLRAVPAYAAHILRGESAIDFAETIDARMSMAETMMLGLRLVEEGVGRARFIERYDRSLTDTFGPELQQLTAWGLLTIDEERIRLSQRGLMVGNQVFTYFLPGAA